MNTVGDKLQGMYAAKRQHILDKLALVKNIFNESNNWWQQLAEAEQANENFRRFIHNIEHNFGDQSPAYALINSDTQKQQHHAAILEAITSYPKDRTAWQHVLS
jgi:DNA-binding FadR family transcriptional regulator